MRKSTIIDLTHQTFGKLFVLEKDNIKTKSGNTKWICQCECGGRVSVIGSHLRSGHTKSCGCNKISDIARGFSATRLYRIWVNMHNRCYNEKHDSFQWYGKKGVTICNEWHNFIPFREWALSNGYNDKLSIDRISSAGNYEPKNCRWKTQKEQMNNVSSNHIIEHQGIKYTMAEFSDNHGLNYWTVNNRIRAGWSLKRIIETPERVGKNEL